MPLAGPVRESEFARTGGFTHSTSLMPLASLNIWIRSPLTCECDSQILFGVDEGERAPGIILSQM
ncbi:hypothetical protein BpHYR1_036080 [Brachionus plicatilis]|uniref:Uncharacterized protein n=1 Tax=Brachionus plicatilis TaxID=10195 RepID=A0A3M7R935_BRAPC|nr:hypothetical protein BpHYR1_036080 [Brachionus plicatilis]